MLAGARQPESLENLRETAPDVRLTPVRLDVTSEEDVRAASDLGRVDILINNAESRVYGSVLHVPMTELQHEIDVNYFGALLMARAFAPAMVAHGDGLIVNVASILRKLVCLRLATIAR